MACHIIEAFNCEDTLLGTTLRTFQRKGTITPSLKKSPSQQASRGVDSPRSEVPQRPDGRFRYLGVIAALTFVAMIVGVCKGNWNSGIILAGIALGECLIIVSYRSRTNNARRIDSR